MTLQTIQCIYMHMQYTVGVFLHPILFFSQRYSFPMFIFKQYSNMLGN